MRHLKKTKKFHRKKGKRQALFKSLINNLIMHGGIGTTEAKAKFIKTKVEKLITVGKKQNLTALRILTSRISKQAAGKIYHDLAPRYKERKGGYLRIIKTTARRKADASKMARIEFV